MGAILGKEKERPSESVRRPPNYYHTSQSSTGGYSSANARPDASYNDHYPSMNTGFYSSSPTYSNQNPRNYSSSTTTNSNASSRPVNGSAGTAGNAETSRASSALPTASSSTMNPSRVTNWGDAATRNSSSINQFTSRSTTSQNAQPSSQKVEPTSGSSKDSSTAKPNLPLNPIEQFLSARNAPSQTSPFDSLDRFQIPRPPVAAPQISKTDKKAACDRAFGTSNASKFTTENELIAGLESLRIGMTDSQISAFKAVAKTSPRAPEPIPEKLIEYVNDKKKKSRSKSAQSKAQRTTPVKQGKGEATFPSPLNRQNSKRNKITKFEKKRNSPLENDLNKNADGGRSRDRNKKYRNINENRLANLPEQFWHDALSKGKFINCDTSEAGIPLYANEFLQLCANAKLLADDNKGFEKRFLDELKKLYDFLDIILKNETHRLPTKFYSYAEYCAYFLPYLYMNASSEIASNINCEKVDNYQAIMIEDYKINDSEIVLKLHYWLPDIDLDELDDDDPNAIKNVRNALLYLSHSKLPEHYSRVKPNAGILALCVDLDDDKGDDKKNSSPIRRRGRKNKDSDKRHRDELSSDDCLFKPSAPHPYRYRKVVASVLLLKTMENLSFCQLARGTKVFVTVLNSLSQAMKQLETMKHMKTNPLFNKYFLAPTPEDFRLPSDNIYLEKQGLNRKQFQAVSAASFLVENSGPEILMVQGPPGTGKSHTIVSIVKTHFREFENRQKVMHNIDEDEKPSVLICAPSNIAIDVIGRRLLQEGFDLTRIGILKKTSDDLRRNHIKLMSMLSDVSKRVLFAEADIILSTLNSSQPMYRNCRQFSLVIIDEAAQCAEPEIIMPLLYKPDTIVLVGDHLQLPPTVKSRDAEKSGYSRSLFERLQSINKGKNMIQLTEQYRMKPEICRMPSNIFYNGSLTSLAENGNNPLINLPPLACFDIVDSKENKSVTSTSTYNLIEKDFIIRILEGILQAGIKNRQFQSGSSEDSVTSDESDSYTEDTSSSTSGSQNSKGKPEHQQYLKKIKIGIICFYKEQMNVIDKEIKGRFNKDLIDVKTVDSFQGQERDIIIVSCCRANQQRQIGFTDSRNRTNVAMTRAKSSLIVVCNERTFSTNSTWRQMFKHFRTQNALHTVYSSTVQERINDILCV